MKSTEKVQIPRRARSLFLTAVLVLVSGCGSSGETAPGSDRISVVATTTILGDVVTNIVGEDADVEVLLPVGADAHSYQLSSAQAATMEGADLIVAIGLGLEDGMTDVIEAVEADGVRVIELAPLLDPIPFADSEEGGEADDPHVWMDPLRMAEAVALITAELDSLAPQGSWDAAADSYAAKLAEADDAIVRTLEAVPSAHRVMVTNHEAFGYFAQRYGFEIEATVIPGGSTLGDPSSAQLAHLVTVMRELEVNVIFSETSQPSVLAEAVAAELGDDVEVVTLYTESLGEAGSDASTYIGMLRANAQRIAEALS